MFMEEQKVADKMTFGVRLQKCRQERHLSAYEAAKQIGVAYKTLERHELGKAYPQMDAFYKYCKFYDVDPWSLMEGIPWEYREFKIGKPFHLFTISGAVPERIIELMESIKDLISRLCPGCDIQVMSDREWLETKRRIEEGNDHEA